MNTSEHISEACVFMPQEEDSIQDQLLVVDKTKFTYRSFLEFLKETGKYLRSDFNQPSLSDVKPNWYNETLFKRASKIYERHFMGVNFAHLSGLLLLVRVDAIYNTLCSTGESDSVAKLFKRYYQTITHVRTWYEGDIFNTGSEAHRSLLIVRGMHNKVCYKLNKAKKEVSSDLGNNTCSETFLKACPVHISKYDIMTTQFAFIGLIVIRSNKMGLLDKFDQKDLESLLHFWRVIGYYLGAGEEHNLCNYKLNDVAGLCEAIMEVEFKDSIRKNTISSPQGIMSLNIVRAVMFIPMLTIYGIMRYLYEILDLETSDLEAKKNWFSRLSLILIDLVMSKLLSYSVLRKLNNSLTRLSFFCIGKVDSWFAKYLDSRYKDYGIKSITHNPKNLIQPKCLYSYSFQS